MALSIEITKGDSGTYRVTLAGELDSNTAEQLGIRMEEVWADANASALRLDLHALTYISSLGVAALAKIKKMIKSRRGAMVVSRTQPQIARVFQLVKMMPKEAVFATREEADAYLKAIQNQVKNP
jgi:anti-anti-sigma factor